MDTADTQLSEPQPADGRRAPTTGSARTEFRDAYGATHTGTGDQYNVALTIMRAEHRRRGPFAVDRSYERELARCFVLPHGYQRAQHTLQTLRVVLLHGAAGTGRRSAAISLLSAFATEDGDPIRVLAAQEDDQEGQEILPEDITDSARLLIDLSDVEDRQTARLLGLLAGILNEVRAHAAVLAVVLGRDPASSVPDELRRSIAPITRPNGTDVFARHLESHGLADAFEADWTTDLRDFLAHVPMSRIRDLASLTKQARDARPANSITEWLTAALAGATSRDDEVTEHARDEDYRSHRALAVSSAMFEGYATGVVCWAEQQLLRTLDFPNSDHALALPDFEQRLCKVRASVVDGQVRFDELNYADALRTYFWTQFPNLRKGFHTWIVTCAPQVSRTEHGHDQLIARYTYQVFQIGRPDLVVKAVEAWASASGSFGLAATALSHGLTNPRYGQYFRRQSYAWATSPSASSNLARLIVSACVAVIAPQHPGQAIVRLHHLTRHPDHSVASNARASLARILQDDFVMRRFLTRLTTFDQWMDDPHNQQLFIDVVDPMQLRTTNRTARPILDSPTVRDQLTTCWAAVFSGLDKEGYAPSVHRWLTAQSESEDDRDLLAVLVRAAAATGSLAALHGIAHRWLATSVTDSDARRRRAVARHLLDKIDVARRNLHRTGEDQNGAHR